MQIIIYYNSFPSYARIAKLMEGNNIVSLTPYMNIRPGDTKRVYKCGLITKTTIRLPDNLNDDKLCTRSQVNLLSLLLKNIRSSNKIKDSKTKTTKTLSYSTKYHEFSMKNTSKENNIKKIRTQSLVSSYKLNNQIISKRSSNEILEEIRRNRNKKNLDYLNLKSRNQKLVEENKSVLINKYFFKNINTDFRSLHYTLERRADTPKRLMYTTLKEKNPRFKNEYLHDYTRINKKWFRDNIKLKNMKKIYK